MLKSICSITGCIIRYNCSLSIAENTINKKMTFVINKNSSLFRWKNDITLYLIRLL